MKDSSNAEHLHMRYELWEYLLVAPPGKEINEKIFQERRNFEKKYEVGKDTSFYPHISIATIQAKEEMEETFIRWIQNICNLQKSFTVTLNNYSGFPSSGLYLRVQDAEPFKRLANALKILDSFMQSNDCPPLSLVSKPHVSLIMGLSPYNFEIAVKEYALKTFHESFNADKLILLKRDQSTCHHIHTFTLPPPLNLFD